jgi:DNA-binding response OmpR family regulator
MEIFLDGNEINFENELRCVSIYNFTPTCKYDFLNNLIKNNTKEYLLTKREDLFIKLLLKKRGIVTYFEMDKFLNIEYKDFSVNAKRLFVKNLRKKLPKNLLANISGVGYKLLV